MKLSTREIVLIAFFAALASVAAVMSRFTAGLVVPFSLVPFVVLFTGMILGPRLGSLSMAVYLLMGLVGLPVFEKPPFGGPVYVVQPTFGFLVGFIISAIVTGTLAPPGREHGMPRYLLASLAGIAAIYLAGLPYLYIILNLYLGKSIPVIKILQIGFFPFIALDLLKGLVASAVARAVLRRVNVHSG